MKKDLIYIIVILLLIFGGFAGKNWYEGKLAEKDGIYKAIVLEKNALQKVSETQYTKLIDDRKTAKELNEVIDSLGIKLKEKPKVIIKTVVVVKPAEDKPIDEVIIKGDSLSIKDSYPDKLFPFVEYTNKIDLKTGQGLANWKFYPININITLSQREDGIWKSDVQVPSYIAVESLDILARPLDIPKIDNFGWILGASFGKDMSDDTEFVRLSAGFRYKKVYLDAGASSNQNLDLGLKFEF